MNKNETVIAYDLSQLVPAPSKFALEAAPETYYEVKPYTLRVQLWATKTFGKDLLQTAITKQDVAILSELCFHMMEDKKAFPSLEDFQDKIVTYKDRAEIARAVLDSMGLTREKLEEIAAKVEESVKKESPQSQPDQSTGANSTTA